MARIVVVGSVASDEVVRLEGRLCEGQHLNGIHCGIRLGGGGANTAVALAAAGHQVCLVAPIGEDEAGQWQLDRLREAGVDVSAIVRVPGSSSRSICMVDHAGERTIVNLGRAQEAAPPERLRDLPAHMVYVRTRAIGLAPLLVDKARSALVVAHVPPVARGVFPAHVIVTSASDLPAETICDPLPMARDVAGDLLRWVVMTKGHDGVTARSVTGETLSVPAVEVRAVDSVGAGDAFAAGLCHALSSNAAMNEALRQGCRWGAAKVARDGSALTAEAVRGLI